MCVLIATRFHAFMAIVVSTMPASASSPKLAAACDHTSSGTPSGPSCRDGLRETERGPLVGREERRVAPCRQRVQAALVDAGRSRLRVVHLEAVGAAVELRDADVDQRREAVGQGLARAVGEAGE